MMPDKIKGNPFRILLIQDNKHDRRDFERSMKMGAVDYNLTVCERAEEAAKLLNRSDDPFDVVAVDFELPGMNGLDLFRKLKRKEKLPPFVMLAEAGSEELAANALREGICDYVVKDLRQGYLNLLPVVLTSAVQRFGHDLARRVDKADLKKEKDELEQKVQERTAELAVMIQALKVEIEEHRRTEAALRQSQEQLRELSRKIIETQENERKLVAQEIHDSISGSLAAIKLALEEKLESMEQKPEPDGISLERIISHVDDAIKESRRISAHLRPSLLDDLGLLSTISWFCHENEKLNPDLQIEQQLDVGEEDIPEKLKVVIYRVLQETMNNVGKHSNATRVHLHLTRRDNCIDLSVVDNGRGFDPEEKFAESAAIGGFGLSSMRDRTLLCDGKFEITSQKGKGTTVHISLPCEAESIEK
jgi:signal transduction histidine kinase